MMHAKTAIIDDAFATIGSYNLDERSWRKNLEVNLAVEDEAFARARPRVVRRDCENARAHRPRRVARPPARAPRASSGSPYALRRLW